MRPGHGPDGAVGVTIQTTTSITKCSSYEQCSPTHEEETKGRIKADQGDRLGLRNTPDVCINAFDNESHPYGELINIMTCQIADPDGNADNALALGQQAMKNSKSGLPATFYDRLGKLIVQMDVKKNICQLVRSM